MVRQRRRNVVEANHVHHIGIKADGEQPILSDMGGIYTLGNQDGSFIRGNRFHDIGALRYGGWGIYFDEGTTDILAENNLVYRTSHGGLHQHFGKDNIVRNNIFAFGRDAQIQRTRLENHQSFTFVQNIVIWKQGSLLAGDWHELNVAFDHNTYWHDPPKDIRFANYTWDQWRKAGVDRNSKIADPRFANRGGRRLSFDAAIHGRAGRIPAVRPVERRSEKLVRKRVADGAKNAAQDRISGCHANICSSNKNTVVGIPTTVNRLRADLTASPNWIAQAITFAASC